MHGVSVNTLIPLDRGSVVMLYFKLRLVECAEEKTLKTPLPRVWWDFPSCILVKYQVSLECKFLNQD